MKINMIIFFMLSTFFFSSLAQNNPDIRLMQEINNAWSTLDPLIASKYYDTTSNNTFYDITPFKYAGWNSYSDGAKEFFKTLTSMNYTVGEDANVHIYGNFAFGTSLLNLETIDKNLKKDSLQLRWTIIWEKKGNNWLIVHEHLSMPIE